MNNQFSEMFKGAYSRALRKVSETSQTGGDVTEAVQDLGILSALWEMAQIGMQESNPAGPEPPKARHPLVRRKRKGPEAFEDQPSIEGSPDQQKTA